jgi:hypothetical protein
MTDRPSPRRPRTLSAGIALTALSVLSLAGTALWMMPKGFVDFPCFDLQQGDCLRATDRYLSGDADAEELGQARMFLCISIYPRGYHGGGTIAQGPVPSDTWAGSGIALARQGQLLVANGQSLAAGESSSRLRILLSPSPWFFAATRTTIANRGVFECALDQDANRLPIDALYAFGSLSEGYFPNPLGPILLVVGIWLLVRGLRQRRRARRKPET